MHLQNRNAYLEWGCLHLETGYLFSFLKIFYQIDISFLHCSAFTQSLITAHTSKDFREKYCMYNDRMYNICIQWQRHKALWLQQVHSPSDATTVHTSQLSWIARKSSAVGSLSRVLGTYIPEQYNVPELPPWPNWCPQKNAIALPQSFTSCCTSSGRDHFISPPDAA